MRTRKYFIMLCFFALVFSLVSCGHTHTFNEDFSKDDTHHWHGASCEHSDEVENKELHNWTSEVTKEAKCDAKGENTYTCTVCGATKVEEISTIEHSWVNADCDTPKTCSACGATEGQALGHVWLEATYESPKTCDVCGQTEGEVLPKPIPGFDFPALDSFKPDAIYASTAINKWEYQAKVEGNFVYIYVVQYFKGALDASGEVDLTENHILVNSEIGDFVLCSNGAYELASGNGVTDIDYCANATNSKTEYYLKVTLENELEGILASIYSYDNRSQSSYNNSDFMVEIKGTYYHSHIMETLYIAENIQFKSEKLYRTPTQYQSPIPNVWGYDMQSSREGLYIYVYQNVSNIVSGNNQKFEDTHVEFSIFHHSFGYGATVGGIAETYVSIWPDKTFYVNNMINVVGVDLESTTVIGNKIEYRLFLRFNNNLDHPQDGPYAFIKVRTFDPTDNCHPYEEKDIVEYRDDRFLHISKGNSLFVYEKITQIDNPFETNYLDSRINTWNQGQFQNVKDMTLFIGDSFFESDNWWINFYNDYKNKACFTSAIGGTTVTQWLNWIPSLVSPFAGNVKNIVIHLGYNDVNISYVTAAQLEVHLQDLFTRIHKAYPEANIYYMGIGTSYWFQSSGNTRAKATDDLTKAYAETCPYLTFIDMDECYAKYMRETGGTLESFFKDGTHPKNENYKYLMNALIESGCVIANK